MIGPTIVIGELTFNGTDNDWRCTALDGWYGTAAPRAELVPSGAAAGAVAVGPWDDSEAYYTMSGNVRAGDRATLMARRRALLAAMPADSDWPLLVQGNGEDIDLTAYVRRYDRADVGIIARNLSFTVPLVALDPLKYGTSIHQGVPFGVFNGDTWFDTFADNTTTFDREPDLPSVNLLSNPDAEQGTTTDWVGVNADIAVDTSQARTGTASYSVTCNQTGPTTVSLRTNGGLLGFEVNPDTSYTFEGWSRSATVVRNAAAQVVWYDADGVQIGTFTGSAFTPTSTSAWTLHTLTTTSPSNAAFALIRVQVQAAVLGEVHYFDDLKVSPTVPEDPNGVPAFLFTQQSAEESTYALSRTLTSDGDQSSRRLTIEVTGPLTQGDWHLTNEATGDELYADLGLVAGQTLVFDCYRQRVTLNGASVDELVFGDFLTLEPGPNTFRLIAGSLTDGFANITRAEPAYS